ncbi:glycosyltransferase [Lentzea sp. NPDC051838]|uniref:glycosyltransferase n=1 Tax=Lentzea sp. NPDC051838 TaxID=3154849 RepID=UPI00342AC52C
MRPLVVLFSGVTWDGVRGSERHLTEALSEYTDILWVDPPVSPMTPQRYRGIGSTGRSWQPSVREAAPGVTRLTPIALPGWTRPGIRATTWPLVRFQVRRTLSRRPHAVIACSFDDVLGRWGSARNVLYGTDDWVSGASLMGQPTDRLRAEERATLARTDVVLAVTPELAARWQEFGADPVVVPNGCDTAAYHGIEDVPPATLPEGFPAEVAGVVGQLTDRIDISYLEAVADTGIGLLLVGPRDPRWEPSRWPALEACPNVHHVGPVPFAELPQWLRCMDVGLTPYADTAFNRASFPLKTLEYLAAGRPVVGTALPATVRLASESEDVVAVQELSGFADAVVRAAKDKSDGRARRQAFAEKHSWSARAAVVAQVIGLR